VPSVSEKQHNAMEAAAHGHSTLGIPKSVGQEFVEADKVAKDAEPRAAGVLVRDADGRVLFARRSGTGDYGGHWALFGGGVESGETDEEAARRELMEESGYQADSLTPVHEHYFNGLNFATFAHDAGSQFIPKLTGEHDAWAWAHPSSPPSPLHPGVAATLGDIAREQEARFTWGPDQLEIIQPENPQPAPPYIEEIDDPGEAAVELEISE